MSSCVCVFKDRAMEEHKKTGIKYVLLFLQPFACLAVVAVSLEETEYIAACRARGLHRSLCSSLWGD